MADNLVDKQIIYSW